MININNQNQAFASVNMDQPSNGGPAFPVSTRQLESEPGFGHQDGPSTWQYGGMTLREYAAIKLRVPDSGTDWLDEMIRKSVRDYFAAKALINLVHRRSPNDATIEAYEYADAMLSALGEA